jgi:flagellar M-ring protein FliF
VNYELSETRREISRAPGTIKRISVAVLLGGIRAKAADGTETWAPRPEAEVTALHDLVSSAIGFDAERGDVITIRSLELQPDAVQGTLAQSSWLAAIDLMSLAQIVVLSVVALVLGLFVLRPILASGNRARPAAPIPIGGPSATPLDRAALTGDGAASRDAALTGEIDEGGFTAALPALGNRGAQNQAAQDQPAPDPVARLRQLIEDRREETVEILRGWMEDRDEQEENA